MNTQNVFSRTKSESQKNILFAYRVEVNCCCINV